MKKVLGGNTANKLLWNCLVQDGAPGGTRYDICSFTDPATFCEFTSDCRDAGTCNYGTFCVA